MWILSSWINIAFTYSHLWDTKGLFVVILHVVTIVILYRDISELNMNSILIWEYCRVRRSCIGSTESSTERGRIYGIEPYI